MGYLISLISLLLAFSVNANIYIGENGIVIKGIISEGDAEKFVETLILGLSTKDKNSQFLQTVELNDLAGGSLSEAIRIAEVIDSLHMFTKINGSCFSACALIYFSGTKRSYSKNGILGVHSIGFKGESLGKNDLSDAKEIFTQNTNILLEQMKKHGVSDSIINDIKNTPSTEISYISLSSISAYKDYVREWASDRCGPIDTVQLELGQQFSIELNDALTSGGEKKYNEILIAASKSGNPEMWFENLGKKFNPNYSHRLYISKTNCYNRNLVLEFRKKYTNVCNDLKKDCSNGPGALEEYLNNI